MIPRWEFYPGTSEDCIAVTSTAAVPIGSFRTKVYYFLFFSDRSRGGGY